MRKIYATGGWLHYPPLEFYYMQGEINVEPVQFILPKAREEVDLDRPVLSDQGGVGGLRYRGGVDSPETYQRRTYPAGLGNHPGTDPDAGPA